MRALAKVYSGFFDLFSPLKHPLLLLLRLYWGYLFFLAGWGKLMKMEETINFFQSINIYMPVLSAWLAALAETLGGICLIAGFMSRFWGLTLTIVMIVAYVTASWDVVAALISEPSKFVAHSAFNYLLTSLIILVFGPGLFSVDYIIGKKLHYHTERV